MTTIVIIAFLLGVNAESVGPGDRFTGRGTRTTNTKYSTITSRSNQLIKYNCRNFNLYLIGSVKANSDTKRVTFNLNESTAECPLCGAVFGNDNSSLWIFCDGCNSWFDYECTGLKDNIPENYYCHICR